MVVDAVVVGAVRFLFAQPIHEDDAKFFEFGNGTFDGGHTPAGEFGVPLVEGVVHPFLTVADNAFAVLLAHVVDLLKQGCFWDTKLGGERWQDDDRAFGGEEVAHFAPALRPKVTSRWAT